MTPTKVTTMMITTTMTKNRRQGKELAKALLGIVVAFAAFIAICAILLPHEMQRSTSKPTGGRMAVPLVVTTEAEGDINVLGIDWEYWQAINPDIVGWITIPNTPIDYPIVQASVNAPTRYLDYDAYGKYNFYGCLYVDAGCTIASPNVIIFGHNMRDSQGSMFTALTHYLDGHYLEAHPDVIIQTPEKVSVLKIRAAKNVSPYGYEKRIEFDSNGKLQEYYLELWESASSRCAFPDERGVEQLFTLVTCNKGGTVRTVVYVA